MPPGFLHTSLVSRFYAIRLRDVHAPKDPPSAIIITDFRTVPIVACVAISRANPGSSFIVSRVSLRNSDYGDQSSKFRKFVIVLLLRCFGPIVVVPQGVRKSFSRGFSWGVRASVISVTHDLTATAKKYPSLTGKMVDLSNGALDVLEKINEEDYSKIFVFNGRTASSQIIASSLAKSPAHEVRIYEWGGQERRTFLLSSYPLHDLVAVSKRISQRARSLGFAYDRNLARRYIRKKLENQFSAKTLSLPENFFSTVIFVGSPHEYASVEVRGPVGLDVEPTKVIAIAMKRFDLPRPIAVRLHPNMARDPSFRKQVTEIEKFCGPRGVTVLGPENSVSSHALILGAKQVVVGNSSIGLDAFFLGKTPVFVGHPRYRGLLEALLLEFGEDGENRERLAGLWAQNLGYDVFRFRGVENLCWLGLRVWDSVSNLKTLRRSG